MPKGLTHRTMRFWSFMVDCQTKKLYEEYICNDFGNIKTNSI